MGAARCPRGSNPLPSAMGLWAQNYIEKLKKGQTVSFRPRGNSMTPIIRSGQQCIVVPLGTQSLQKGDVVLCKVKGNHYLHKILSVGQDKYLIGNNHGGKNGWIKRDHIYGLLAGVGV